MKQNWLFNLLGHLQFENGNKTIYNIKLFIIKKVAIKDVTGHSNY